MTDLAARATRLGPAFDLLAGYREGGFFLERAGLGLSTIGEADRVTAETVLARTGGDLRRALAELGRGD